jgi:abequosyltransferase
VIEVKSSVVSVRPVGPLISFCIPTLNRAPELAMSLESIVREATQDVEVVIVDGGSTDNTMEVIETFRGRLSRISVHTSQTRSGVDRDILQSVALARGTFCWLFSDDDVLEPGAVSRVAAALRQYPDIAGLSTNYAAYDASLKFRIATVPAVSQGRLRTTHLFMSAAECFACLGVHLGFISAQVVRRDYWQSVAESEDLAPQCNAWIIVYMIGRMIASRPNWLYFADVCVRYRSGNDSFIARIGVIRRQEITHVNYDHTIASLFPRGSKPYRDVFRILLRDRMPRSLAVLKARGIGLRTQRELFRMYYSRYHDYSDFWIRVAPIFLVPSVVLRAVKATYLWRVERSEEAREVS